MLYTLSGGTCFESRSGNCLCAYESLSALSRSRQANSAYNGYGSLSSPYPPKIHKALSVLHIVVEV